MQPIHGPLIYEGKAKRVFSSNETDNQVFVEFKDDATAFNALKHSKLEGKGSLNCQISALIFKMLAIGGVKTHYKQMLTKTWMLVERVEIIPLEIVIRNIATGSLCRETPIKEGIELNPPLLEFYYKDDTLQDPLLTEARLDLLGLINKKQRTEIEKIALKVNSLLQAFFLKIDLILVDFKIEIGLNNAGELVVADEISPDSCRIWDKTNLDKDSRILDKDRFRKDLGGVIEAYEEILRRVLLVTSNSPT